MALIHRLVAERTPFDQQTLEDHRDVALAVAGDHEAFVRLYQRYITPVYRFLVARLQQHHDAEEVAALAFERTWQSLAQFKPNGSFVGWLFTIVRRCLADFYRRGQRSQQQTHLSDQLASQQLSPELAMLALEQQSLLQQAVAQLTPEQQELLQLRFFAQLPYATIAQIVGKREAAVKMAAYRALEQLKRRLADDQ
ncbi:RNA polymerase sigma factor [Herpetosiphon llansteffanensis]|uniref:RNA polymerase sigma factor n=1 Tax=Herpetosiphon llansteffanensis TaxID=2094568 RepID=UPI0013E08206|nr:sigma-70 family RNA polymerase sigma factor [Herpetosiphon llansteffanensis]